MPSSHRTTARGLLSVLALSLAAGAAAASALAAGDGGGGSGVPDPIVFPVVGAATYTDDYGEPRGDTGRHEGIDIVAAKRSFAVAAEAGTVKFWTTSANAGCMLYLYGASGTTYLYIHLNNDLTAGNDNRGKCVPGTAYAPGLKDGAQVEAGQPIGLVGDSGDANGIASHLHFEVHPHDGASTDPFPHLNKAVRLLFLAAAGTSITLSLVGSVVAADAKSLSLKVDQAQVFPSGATIGKLTKPLRLTLTPNAWLDRGKGPLALVTAQAAASLAGKSVVVLTEPTPSSVATQTGRDGAFTTASIVVTS
jgi:murein DD-endopeptidase MepM/ murein hydrolase activator NlpD